MVSGRRRSTRGEAQKVNGVVEDPKQPEPETNNSEVRAEEDSCPACQSNPRKLQDDDAGKVERLWVRCDACKAWYHWECVGEGDLDAIDKWYINNGWRRDICISFAHVQRFCETCSKSLSRVTTYKAPARKSSRKRTQRDYANLNDGLQSDPHKWTRILEQKNITEDPFKRMKGADVGLEWLGTDESAMREPVVIEVPEGLGLEMPPGLSVAAVAEAIGRDTPVEVIDVATQSTSPGWNLGKWADYYALPPSSREKILNVISLEISGTALGEKILPPRLVRELDWVEKFWPPGKKGKGSVYPKVQLYCLMGVANAWTDWHIDFAGSSVYYHIISGSKVFYFIRPTPVNLAAYERWSGSEIQTHLWLGDMVDEVFKIQLQAGNTMIIPAGWIHAVYTPVDTLVFGGNFLHSYDIPTQLKIRSIELATHVPKKFRFPLFTKLCWYVGEKFLRDIKSKEEYAPRVLESVEALSEFLVSEVRKMERGSDSAKKEAKEQVPGDRVKDPASLARELRWRVRLAIGCTSDGEESSTTSSSNLNGDSTIRRGNKRKRPIRQGSHDTQVPFKNFKPRLWDIVEPREPHCTLATTKSRRPCDVAELRRHWSDWENPGGREGGGEEAAVSTTRSVELKVRITANGIERQRVERILEEWVWEDDGAKSPSQSLMPSDTEMDVSLDP